MALSLETQEILLAFADENKANEAAWGKYEIDELQDAYAEMPEQDKVSATGRRIQERIAELEAGQDHLQALKQQASVNPLDVVAEADTIPHAEADTVPDSEPPPAPAAPPPAAPGKLNPFVIGAVVLAAVLVIAAVLLW